MKITKVKDTYDTYRAELSWAEIHAIVDGLEECGTGAVTDELLQNFQWNLDRLAGPGEEESDGKDGEALKGEGAKSDLDGELPAPSGKEPAEELGQGLARPDTEGGLAPLPPVPGGESEIPPPPPESREGQPLDGELPAPPE